MNTSKYNTFVKDSFQKLRHFWNDNRGFSLVELGVVIVIGAVMMIPIYSLLFYVTDLRATDDRMTIIQEALAEHFRVTGTLPCPAPITLNIDDDTNAYEASCSNTIPIPGPPSSPSLYIGAVPIANLKIAVDCARNDGGLVDLTNDTASALKDSIYSLGEIFTGTSAQTLFDGSTKESTKADGIRCPLNEYILDDHGHKFIYAVSRDATRTNFDPFNPSAAGGAIRLENTSGNILGAEQPYVLISLGEDGKGAYDRTGTQIGDACGTSDSDSENCDYNDNVFVVAPQNPSTNNHYDDLIDYNIASFLQEDSFWSWGDESSGARDMMLGPRTILTIGPRDDVSASLNIEDDDGVIVNRGGILIEDDLDVHAQIYYDDTSSTVDTNGGNLESNSISATNQETTIRDYSVSGQYCYEASKALTNACGATP